MSESYTTLSVRVPREVYEKYRSLPSLKRQDIYRALQAFAIQLIENGEVQGGLGKVEYHIKISRPEKVNTREVEKLYIYVVEALRLTRQFIVENAPLDKTVKTLRKALAAIALNTVDKKVETQLKNIQRSFRRLIDLYIEKREEEVKQILEEIEKQLFQLKEYLAEKYPVF